MTKPEASVNHPVAVYNAEQLDLIKSTVAKGATNDELKLFLYRCENLGLDPLKPGQIYFIKYGNSPGTIVVGIDGFRAKANSTGLLSGIKRGALRDDKGNLIGGWAEVYRSDWNHPAREEVPLSEYNTGKSQWAKMPETMIKKVAECAALRMAFPDALGGVYAPEEMDQASSTQKSTSPTPQHSEDKDAASVIKEFYDLYEKMADDLGQDCYKKYLCNAAGQSPTIEQVLNWKSTQQINWLRQRLAEMKVDWQKIKQTAAHKADENDLPMFDDMEIDAECEVINA